MEIELATSHSSRVLGQNLPQGADNWIGTCACLLARQMSEGDGKDFAIDTEVYRRVVCVA
jgi:hypothetical protein